MISPHRAATEMLEAMHEKIRHGDTPTPQRIDNVIGEAQVYATLALAEAIQGMDNTLHDALRSIAAVIGDLGDR